jgi:hypothetical protein
MAVNNRPKRSKIDLLLAVISTIMIPYGYAGEISMRSKDISPIYSGSLFLICSIVLFIKWYRGK